jgi:hypothetical protein
MSSVVDAEGKGICGETIVHFILKFSVIPNLPAPRL